MANTNYLTIKRKIGENLILAKSYPRTLNNNSKLKKIQLYLYFYLDLILKLFFYK
jgi:hypothetical protein